MKALRFAADAIFTFGRDETWSGDGPMVGILNLITEQHRRKIGPADGEPRDVLFHLAKTQFTSAESIETPEGEPEPIDEPGRIY